MDLNIPTVLSSGTFTVQLHRSFFGNFHQKWKNGSCGAQFRHSQIKQVKNRSVRLKILTNESPMQSYIKNQVKLWELIKF